MRIKEMFKKLWGLRKLVTLLAILSIMFLGRFSPDHDRLIIISL